MLGQALSYLFNFYISLYSLARTSGTNDTYQNGDLKLRIFSNKGKQKCLPVNSDFSHVSFPLKNTVAVVT
jgi:hypothetical protein